MVINEDDTIGDVVRKHPETIPIMLEYGLHCVGCHVAAHETLGQGCRAHGMDEKAITAMLNDMDAAVKAASKGPVITVTDAAAARIKEAMAQRKTPKAFVRVIAIPSCGGLRYDMRFEDKKGKDDTVFKEDGLSLLIDKVSLSLVRGATIDFVEQGEESGFSIRK